MQMAIALWWGRIALLLVLAIAPTTQWMLATARGKLVARGVAASPHLASKALGALRCSLFSTEPAATVAPPSTTSAPSLIIKPSDLSALEIRVGKIVEIQRHPEADSLFIEKVDIGEPQGPRTIVSGLVAFCTEESLLGRKVVVLCNLKPRALKGVESQGMLLCVSNSDRTQITPLHPPEDSVIGELITFDGHSSSPLEPGNKASKVYSKIAPDFYVNDEGEASFKGIAFQTSAGPIKCLLKGKIS